jgi:hypothetical protein
MSQQELLSRVVAVLTELGIDYMMTGSYVSSMQGEPRMSHDIGLVVALSEDDAVKRFHAFPESDYYLPLQKPPSEFPISCVRPRSWLE